MYVKNLRKESEGKLRHCKEKAVPEVSEGEGKAMGESSLLEGLKAWKGKIVVVKVRRLKENGGYYTENHTGKILEAGASLTIEGKTWASEDSTPCLFLEEKHVIQAIYLSAIEDVDDEVASDDPLRVHFSALNRP